MKCLLPRWPVVPLLAAGLAGCSTTGPAPVQTLPYQGPDEPLALRQFVRQRVAHSRQPVLYFYADWCGPCRRFRAALASQPLGEALQTATLVKLSADDYPQLAQRFAVTAIPAFLKVDSTGRVLAHITSGEWGEDTPARIAPVLRELVRGHRYDAAR